MSKLASFAQKCLEINTYYTLLKLINIYVTKISKAFLITETYCMKE